MLALKLSAGVRTARGAIASPGARQLVPALLLGSILGLATVVVGPLLSMAAMVAVLAVGLAFSRPEALLLVLLGFVTQIIPARLNPYLSVGGRGLYVSDLTLLLLFGVLALRLIADRGFRPRATPLDRPLLLFGCAVLLGMLTAIRGGTSFSATTYDARILLYYTAFFVVTNLVRTRQQLVWLVKALLVLGTLVAAAMLVQAFLGRSATILDQSILFSERAGSDAVIRFYNPGTMAVFVTFMIAICMLALEGGRPRTAAIAMLLVTSAGLLLTLNRNLVIAGALSFVILLYLLRRHGWSRLTLNLLLAVAAGLAALLLLVALGGQARLLEYVSAFSDRLASVLGGSILSPSETLNWRVQELHYAWPVIQQHPIFGIGLDTPYRPPFYAGDTLRSYIHNAYASLWLKTGLPGLLAFAWLGTAFLVRGFRHWQQADAPLLRAVTLGSTLAFLALALSNVVAPFFVQDWSLAVFAVMFAVNELTFALAMRRPNEHR